MDTHEMLCRWMQGRFENRPGEVDLVDIFD